MRELEERAGRAWALMFSWAMPAGIALDFVQEATGDRAQAADALFRAAAPTFGTGGVRACVGGTFPNFEVSEIAAAVGRGDPGFAAVLLRNVKARLFQQERAPLAGRAPPAALAGWIDDWLPDAERAVDLCRQLEAAP